MKHSLNQAQTKGNIYFSYPFCIFASLGENKRMKIKLYLFVICVFILSQPVLAQKDSTVNRNITVEREYVPTIKNSGKIATTPSILEPKKTRLDVIYSDFNFPLSLGNNIHPLTAATLLYDQQKENRLGFARFGLGTYPNTLADFAYPLVQRPDMRIDAVVRHRGAYGAKMNTVTHANLKFDKYFDALTLFAGIDGGYTGLKYYGLNFNRDNEEVDLGSIASGSNNAKYMETHFASIGRPAQEVLLENIANASDFGNFWRFGANFGFRSAEDAENWRYLGQIKYNLFHNTAGVSEHLIHANGQINFIFSEDRIGADIDLYNAYYSSESPINFWEDYVVLRLTPYYELNRNENLNLRLGLSAAIPLVNDVRVKISPDVRFEWKALPEWLGIYAGLTGEYKVNSMNTIFAENWYLAPDVRVDDTYTPLEFYMGLKVKPMRGLLLDVFADYSSISNQYFFKNKSYEYVSGVNINTANRTLYSNRFDVVYDNGTLFKTGARISYYYLDKVNVELKGVYNAWSLDNEKYAWNKPQYEIDFNATFNITKDLNMSLAGYYQDGIYAKLGDTSVSMKPRIDINLGASYTYFDWLTFFAKVNNLINSKYDIFYGYEVQGINFMVGATVSF